MGLARYKQKRDFSRTPEPEPQKRAPGPGMLGASFVVQKHAASHLHFDFRLEHEGVLKSWAVPKGPSLNPSDKRLAVEVEDHPIEYGGFEGTIPKGEYGGGTVMLWDRGTWAPLNGESPRPGLRSGMLKFTLRGQRLRGAWMLVRLKGQGEKPNWLLVKEKDEHAATSGAVPITESQTRSISTGRTMEEIAKGGAVWRSDRAAAEPETWPAPRREKHAAPASTFDVASLAGARPARMPRTPAPQLAQRAAGVPAGDGWTHEVKFDGYRILALCDGADVTLLSRNGLPWSARFPEIRAALAHLALPAAVLDGEAVSLRGDGVSDFRGLQDALKSGRTGNLVYMVFDVLHWGGFDLTGCSLEDRRRALHAGVRDEGGAVRLSRGLEGSGEDILPLACRLGLEGIVSKRLASAYSQGRTGAWMKIRCGKRQEFVVGGMTHPRNSRSGFGALLIGAHDRWARLVYAGRVGSGFDDEELGAIERALKRRSRETSPFADLKRGPEARGALWTEPTMVIEVSYTGWTTDRRLRHPVFKGVREDKPAAEVVLEPPINAHGSDRDAPEAPMKKPSAAEPRPSRAAPKRDASIFAPDAPILGIAITHPDRVVYPEVGITKREVAEYYAAVSEWMMPHAAMRPLSIVRRPGGAGSRCFFHKHVDVTGAPGLRPVRVRESDGIASHAALTNAEGLIYLAQMNALELHAWGARADNVDKPDRLVIDLDPGEGVGWAEIVAGALTVREAMRSLGLESFVKTTGGKGLHVAAPVQRRMTWLQAKALTRAVAVAVFEASPGKFVTSMSKAIRKGKVFIDYLRNDYGATSVLPFSTRARPGATVSMPVQWDELGDIGNAAFTVRTAIDHLRRRKQDPWIAMLRSRQGVAASLLKGLLKDSTEP